MTESASSANCHICGQRIDGRNWPTLDAAVDRHFVLRHAQLTLPLDGDPGEAEGGASPVAPDGVLLP